MFCNWFDYNVVIISTDGSFDGVIAGEDGGCFSWKPGFPTVFFNTISMFANAEETWYKFSINML